MNCYYTPDALSCLLRSDTPREPIDDFFPDDPPSPSPLTHAGPGRPVLEGIFSDHLNPAGIEGQRSQWSLSAVLASTADRSAERSLAEPLPGELVDNWHAGMFPFAGAQY